MSYAFPAHLSQLRAWLERQHVDITGLRTERQAAFFAQQLAGTRFKFPEKGKSCLRVLESIQDALPETAVGSKPAAKGQQKKPSKANGKVHPLPAGMEQGLVIFTDGACEPNPGAGGWGFAVYRDGVEIHAECGGNAVATNQTMELTAALMALRWFAGRGVVETVRLLSDSQYVVKGCNEWRHGWKAKGWKRGGPNAKPENSAIANLELWKELDEALTLVPIQLQWVKGHVGIIGNERADELSLMGREKALPETPHRLIDQQLQYAV